MTRPSTTPRNPDRLTDVDEVAESLGVATRFVRRLVAERRIPFVKVGKFVRFDPAQISQCGWTSDDASRILMGSRVCSPAITLMGVCAPCRAIGGFHESDPVPTLGQFKTYGAERKIHYFIAGGGSSATRRDSRRQTDDAALIVSWAESHASHQTIGGVKIYDIAPGHSF